MVWTMKKLNKLFCLLAVIVALTLLSVWLRPARTYADVNDFVITNFQADYTLSADKPAGLMRVKEVIDVNFSDYNHGILRAIPASYNGHNIHLRDISIDGWPFSTYSQNGHVVLKIGDPNQTVTGRQKFVIHYTLQNVITFYDDHDELYWDIN